MGGPNDGQPSTYNNESGSKQGDIVSFYPDLTTWRYYFNKIGDPDLYSNT